MTASFTFSGVAEISQSYEQVEGYDFTTEYLADALITDAGHCKM